MATGIELEALKERLDQLELVVSPICEQSNCRLHSIPEPWVCIPCMDAEIMEGIEHCDCLIVSTSQSHTGVIAVELKSGRYHLNKARRQLEGSLEFFRDVIYDGNVEDIRPVPVILSNHHDRVAKRAAFAYRVRFHGRNLTIVLADCGIPFDHLQSRLTV